VIVCLPVSGAITRNPLRSVAWRPRAQAYVLRLATPRAFRGRGTRGRLAFGIHALYRGTPGTAHQCVEHHLLAPAVARHRAPSGYEQQPSSYEQARHCQLECRQSSSTPQRGLVV
jgi:hypothetical protein